MYCCLKLSAAVDGPAAEESGTEGRSVVDSTMGVVTKETGVFSRKGKEREGGRWAWKLERDEWVDDTK